MQLQLCLHWKPSLPNLTKSKHMEDSDENNSSLAILYIWAVISKWFFPRNLFGMTEDECNNLMKIHTELQWMIEKVTLKQEGISHSQ